MGLIDAAKRFLTLEPMQPTVQTRAIDSFTDHPGLTEQLLAVQGLNARPWRPASVRDALGVPSIHRAVTLISNTGGALTLEAFRRGAKLPDDERPRIIVRPNPFTTPRDFFRDTFYSMATRGESWWWVAARDADGVALSLIPVNPAEVTVREDPRDLRYPIVEWRGQRMRNGDMVQITLMREPGSLRGYGPLQMCGAAVSIAVEAQEWAANFYAAGGYPNIWIKAAGDLSGDEDDPDDEDGATSEIRRLKAQWIETAPNTPKVTDEGIIDIKQFDPNPQGAQMLDARDHQNGDTARMFGIPGSLLDYKAPGSNLTYQNLEQEMTKFLRTCLIPNYLEPVEQAISDLLTRSTVARFHVDEVNRADVKTRYEVYEIGIRSGVLDPELAQQMEGIVPGDVETAPVPIAVPAAIPTSIPTRSRAGEVRCTARTTKRRGGVTVLATCNRKLAEQGPFVGKCPRCKAVYQAA